MRNRASHYYSLLLAIATALTWPAAAGAQSVPKRKGPERTVAMFNFYCLSRLPDLESIERAAGLGEYDQLLDEDASPYAPQAPAERFHAWRFHDQGDAFVLTAFLAVPSEAVMADASGFSRAPAASCSFHIPASNPAAILAELTGLLGRAADKSDLAQGEHIWNLKTPKAFSQVSFSAPTPGGAVLRGLVLLKN